MNANRIDFVFKDIVRSENEILALLAILLAGKKETIDDVSSVTLTGGRGKCLSIEVGTKRFEFKTIADSTSWVEYSGGIGNVKLFNQLVLDYNKSGSLNRFFYNH